MERVNMNGTFGIVVIIAVLAFAVGAAAVVLPQVAVGVVVGIAMVVLVVFLWTRLFFVG